ncbi:hypothetical protein [Streptomyces sp. NPDC058157]|uniref:terpene synthase family protein n=1 Tax=Streptomyces sp. NPDC058157 TaxID=3346360 RepID=UPI0036EF9A36
MAHTTPPRGPEHGVAQEIRAVLDELTVLLPISTNPLAEEIEATTVAWLAALPIGDRDRRRRLRASRIGLGTAASFPHVPLGVARLISRLALYLIAFDDTVAEDNAARDLPAFLRQAAPVWRTLQDFAETERLPGPWTDPLHELLDEADSLLPQPVAQRVRQAARDYLFAAAWEASARADATPPAFDEYQAMFRHATQSAVSLTFLEATFHGPSRVDPLHGERIRRGRTAAADLVLHIGRLASHPIEEARGTAFAPAPPPSGAPDHATRARACAETIIRLRDTCAHDPVTGPYSRALAAWAAGVVHWHRLALTTRYALPAPTPRCHTPGETGTTDEGSQQ